MVEMRIQQRGSKWVVLPENGDKVLGTHDTKEDALAQLRAIEASKSRHALFEAQRGPDGKVRTGVWDYVCVEGEDEKDGQSTRFDPSTLGQMIDNFSERGDDVPIDANHQSNYVQYNGQPAYALGFYSALALVWDGKIIKTSKVDESQTYTEGLDLSKNGLWAYRTEVTEFGDKYLPGYKYLSPTFISNGTRRDGSECGYLLCAVAATNSPWQAGTQITFDRTRPTGVGIFATMTTEPAAFDAAPDSGDTASKKGTSMNPEMMAKLGLSEGSTPEEKEAAFGSYFAQSEAEKAKFAADAEAATEMAKFEADKADEDKPKDEEKTEMAQDDNKASEMAVMAASIQAMGARLAKYEQAESDREKAAQKEREQRFSQLADQAEAGGYPKEARGALIEFARSNFDAAYKLAQPFLPKSGAPAQLFDRVTRQGGPIGGDTNVREMAGPVKARSVKTPFGNFKEVDGTYAEEIKKTAESKDPALMAKVDKYLSAAERPQMFSRLLAAEKIVRAERPDLADSDE